MDGRTLARVPYYKLTLSLGSGELKGLTTPRYTKPNYLLNSLFLISEWSFSLLSFYGVNILQLTVIILQAHVLMLVTSTREIYWLVSILYLTTS